MAVRRLAPVNIGNVGLTAHPIYFLCDTTAEMTALTGLKLGDTALTVDTNILYKAATSTTWTPVSAASLQTFTKGATFVDTTAVAPRTVTSWVAPLACTVTALNGFRVGGTGATVQAYRNTTASPLRSTALSLTSASTWMPGTPVQNTAFAAGNSLLLGVLTVTGAVTEASVQVTFTAP